MKYDGYISLEGQLRDSTRRMAKSIGQPSSVSLVRMNIEQAETILFFVRIAVVTTVALLIAKAPITNVTRVIVISTARMITIGIVIMIIVIIFRSIIISSSNTTRKRKTATTTAIKLLPSLLRLLFPKP